MRSDMLRAESVSPLLACQLQRVDLVGDLGRFFGLGCECLDVALALQVAGRGQQIEVLLFELLESGLCASRGSLGRGAVGSVQRIHDGVEVWLVASVAGTMLPQNLSVTDQECAGHLRNVVGGLADEVAAQHRVERAPDSAQAEQLSERPAVQAKAGKQDAVWVCYRTDILCSCRKEGFGFFGRSSVDEDWSREARLLGGVRDLAHDFTGEDSTEVPKKDQQRRF